MPYPSCHTCFLPMTAIPIILPVYETGPESQEILKFASWSDCCQHGAWYFLQEAENLGTENSVQDCSGDFDDLPHSTI